MTTFAGGLTPTQFYNGLNYLQSFHNVKEYGALGNGVADDTVAIQTGINAVIAAGGGVLYFPNGIYIIGGALQTNVGGINYKSQLYIPFDVWNTTTGRNVITLLGETAPSFLQSWGIGVSAVVPITGVILRSTLISNTAYSYVIASQGAAGNGSNLNGISCNIENIQIQITPDANSKLTIGGIGFNNASSSRIKNVTVFPYNLGLTDSAAPLNNCVGIAVAKIASELGNIIDNCSVGGFETGYLTGDHTSLHNVTAMCCKYGFNFGANWCIVNGTKIEALWCINSLYFSGNSYVNINDLEVEWDDLGKWYDSVYTVLDASNYGHGEVHYNINEASVGFNNAKFSKSGGANLQCMPIAFAAASEFTVTGANDAAKLASLMAVLKAKGIITY